MDRLPWDTITSKLNLSLPEPQLTLSRLGIGGRKDTEQATKWYEKVHMFHSYDLAYANDRPQD